MTYGSVVHEVWFDLDPRCVSRFGEVETPEEVNGTETESGLREMHSWTCPLRCASAFYLPLRKITQNTHSSNTPHQPVGSKQFQSAFVLLPLFQLVELLPLLRAKTEGMDEVAFWFEFVGFVKECWVVHDSPDVHEYNTA